MPKTNKSKSTPKIPEQKPNTDLEQPERPKQKPGAKPGDDWQEKYKYRKKRATRYTASKSFKTTPEASKHIKSCAKSLGMSESKYLRDISQLPLDTVKKLLSEPVGKN